MKKIIYLGMLFSSFYGFSQLREKGTIELTPQIGYASANYYGEDIADGNKPISSATFGVGSDYFFNNRWSLRSGIFLRKMGTKTAYFQEKLNYVTIPVNANWHFGSTRKWNLNFGLNAGFLTSAKTNETDIKSLVNSTQFGIGYGIGYKIEVSENFSILLDTQGMTGLSEIAKSSEYSFKNAFSTINVGGVIKL